MNITWDTLQSAGVEDHKLLWLVQYNFRTPQHVLEPTRAARVLDIVLSSQKEFVDNVVIQEPLGSSDHNQLHFNIKLKSDKTKVKQCRRYLGKVTIRKFDLTRFNKIATQGAPQMAVDKEANSLSRVNSYYSKFILCLFYV